MADFRESLRRAVDSVPIEKWKNDLDDYGATITTGRLPLFVSEFEIHWTVCHEVMGGKPGFFIGITAGTHGDEETSIEIAHTIAGNASLELVEGALVAIPWANPGAVMRRSRLTPHVVFGEADLNRAFTTVPDGSSIQQHAYSILRYFQRHYRENGARSQEAGIIPKWPFTGLTVDVHTEDTITGTTPESDVLPYIRIDPVDNDELLGFMIRCAMVAGVPWVMEYTPEGYKEEGLDRSLTAVLAQKVGIPAITFEAGPGGGVFPRFVEITQNVFANLFRYFHMRLRDQENVEGVWAEGPNPLSSLPRVSHQGYPLRLADAYACDAKGNTIETPGRLYLDRIKPGQFVKQGQQIGRLEHSYSLREPPLPVYAPFDGAVLSVTPVQFRHGKGTLAYMAAVPITDDERLIKIYREQRLLIEG